MLEDIGLKHEVDETREAERYKFGDGGTRVSSIRVTAPVLVVGKKGRIVFRVVPSKHLPLLNGRDFLTLARFVVVMGEPTLMIGTGVDNLVVSRAGHLALRLNPRDWHREVNLTEDIPVRLRARLQRQDPRTERLLQLIATVLIGSRCSPSTSPHKVSRSCLKNVAQYDCSHETLCTRCVSTLIVRTSVPMILLLPLNPVVLTAEVDIVEEEQNMWRRVKKGTKLQLDAGRRSSLLLSSQRVKPHFIAESLIASTIKNALSRAPREALPATGGSEAAVRSTPVAMRCVRESATSWTSFTRKTSHGQRVR